MSTPTPEPVVLATEYTVSCLPNGHQERHHFEITVERWRGDLWRLKHAGYYLTVPGEWSPDRQLAVHADLDTSLLLARQEAPKVTVNGYTVADALKMGAGR
jgi:hypothetical protein